MAKTYVTIKNDDEGFYSGEPHDNIDHDASLREFQNQITERVAKMYGDEVEIEHYYGVYGGASIITEGDGDLEEISEEVGEIVCAVYEYGTFWVEK